MLCPHCQKEIQVYRNPVPTVDIIIEIEDAIVLIKRKNPPYGWALPGGFVDYGEPYETAALREAKEETGLVVENLQQFRTYSDPKRDPRQHTASTVFIAQADTPPTAGDDAAEAALFTETELPHLVFDHARILSDYFAFRKEKTEACHLHKGNSNTGNSIWRSDFSREQPTHHHCSRINLPPQGAQAHGLPLD